MVSPTHTLVAAFTCTSAPLSDHVSVLGVGRARSPTVWKSSNFSRRRGQRCAHLGGKKRQCSWSEARPADVLAGGRATRTAAMLITSNSRRKQRRGHPINPNESLLYVPSSSSASLDTPLTFLQKLWALYNFFNSSAPTQPSSDDDRVRTCLNLVYFAHPESKPDREREREREREGSGRIHRPHRRRRRPRANPGGVRHPSYIQRERQRETESVN